MNRLRQRGFSIVSALFIVVALAFLGLMMVTIGEMQRTTVSYAAQGARAYHAARTGIEWGIFQATSAGACAASTNFALTVPGLDGFSVTVQCVQTAHRENSPPDFNVYALTSTAVYGTFGDPYYFSRTLQATVTNAP